MDDTLYPIGELARRTGLTVKAIRFYSDRGIVAPAARSPVGYRLYDVDAVQRFDLVRTLRDLGMGLPVIRQVMERELLLTDVAAAHAEALDVQIRSLRLRRAVLTAVARRGATPEEMNLMNRLATLSEAERRRLVRDFLDAAFGALDADPTLEGVTRTMTPELPENADAEQIQAWIEWAELSQDPDFRALLRRMAEEQWTERPQGDNVPPSRDLAATVRDQVVPVLAAGIQPASSRAEPVVAALTDHYAHLLDSPNDAELHHRLLVRLESMNDPRREKYFRLLAVINGWTAPESLTPVLDWSIQALRPRIQRSDTGRESAGYPA